MIHQPLTRALLTCCVPAFLVCASAQQADRPATKPADRDQAAATPDVTNTKPKDDVASTNAPSTAITEAKAEPSAPQAPADGKLRLNFRSAPLELVLNYLSEAAGFIIILETEVKGKVDVFSNQPLDKDEAVDLLNTVLGKNGYTALRNGRTLTIVSKDDAKRRDIPVKSGSDPAGIPKSEEIVTQIIPVKYINATQLTRDLTPLLPEKATLTANEGGNALVITDTQVNIRRMAEIIKALDTSVASISAVRVFALKYADAKSLASVIKEVFQDPSSGRNNANDIRTRILNQFRGGGGGFGPFGGGPGGGNGGGGGQDSGSNSGRVGASRVAAVSDDRSNSLIVSAPNELMDTIEELVNSVDTNVEDVTELRVFKLKNSDPSEMADLLTDLFQDNSRSTDSNTRGAIRFGGPGGFGGGPGGFGGGGGGRQGGNSNASDQSDRMKKKTQVVAVPDARTGSVVVSAAHDLMIQIAKMVEQLDANPAKKQKVFVYSLENADAQSVEEILRGLFESQNNRRTTSGSQQNSALSNRANQRSQNQNSGNSSFGSGNNSGSFGRQNAP